MDLIAQIYNTVTKKELKFQKENLCLETKILKKDLKNIFIKVDHVHLPVQHRENCPNLQL